MLDILTQRQEDGMTLKARKAEKSTTEVDRDLSLNIYMNGETRSTNTEEQDPPRSAISQALAVLPVAVPESWAMSALPSAELESIRGWSVDSIAYTFAALYMTEFMDLLSGHEIKLLKAFIGPRHASDEFCVV
ncbi:gp37 domain protein [Escherichia phage YDC107_1]|nr:gp37 domain protein [Escherichia phage YDC107_1]